MTFRELAGELCRVLNAGGGSHSVDRKKGTEYDLPASADVQPEKG
jgi:hypothetical protein